VSAHAGLLTLPGRTAIDVACALRTQLCACHFLISYGDLYGPRTDPTREPDV